MRIVITGSSSGIGAALCRYYARPGFTICLIAHNNMPALKEVADSCIKKGAMTFVYSADVSDAGSMKSVSNDILEKIGVPDVVIANAGIRIEDPANYVDSPSAQQVMMTNYIGVINTFASFIEPMKQRKKGQLAAISSISALRATPNSGIYSASKAAVNLWTEALRLTLAPYNVRVTTACSGFVKTAMTEDLPFYMPGILNPDQAACIIARAIDRRVSRIVFPWQSRFIWGIFSVMPGWFYDEVILLAKKFWPNRKRLPTPV